MLFPSSKKEFDYDICTVIYNYHEETDYQREHLWHILPKMCKTIVNKTWCFFSNSFSLSTFDDFVSSTYLVIDNSLSKNKINIHKYNCSWCKQYIYFLIRRNLASVWRQKDFIEVPYDKSGIPFKVSNNNSLWSLIMFSFNKKNSVDESFFQPLQTPEYKKIINILDIKYKQQILDDYIISMSITEQKMLYLKYTVWLSYNEIAMILEISKDMVSYKITSLYKELKTYVDSLYNNDRIHW